ncbi:MAG: hypothetical protein A4E65_02935 [Syntrophorhabdus sp. PtaU1.Bin153]|nr:MAG: hypothetical protein A4E65_02935 [Syntrophorhabdus sp. PtaU1.Bin153]
MLFVDKPLIVKRGGHEDQLSRKYEAMDKFRIESILKMIRSGMLGDVMLRAALEELKKKCLIYANGARKRGRPQEADLYLNLCNPETKYAFFTPLQR